MTSSAMTTNKIAKYLYHPEGVHTLNPTRSVSALLSLPPAHYAPLSNMTLVHIGKSSSTPYEAIPLSPNIE